MASGMSESSLEWQIFSHARPGTVDTSAVPNDSGQQSRDDEPADEPGAAADIRGAGDQVASGHLVRRRCGRAYVLVRARQGREVLGAIAEERTSPSHPQGRRGQHRRARGHPARVLQYRVVFGAVLGESHHRSAAGRSEAPRLRPDAVRHRPVPARLRELPRHRRSPAEHRRFLVDRPPGRSVSSARSCRRRRRSSHSSIASSGQTPSRAARRCSPRRARAAIRASRAPWTASDRLPCSRRGPARPAEGLPEQRETHPGHRGRHIPLARAALESHEGTRVGGVRLRDSASEATGRGHRGTARRRARILPSDLAAERLGVRPVHAQQRDRPRGLRQADRSALELYRSPYVLTGTLDANAEPAAVRAVRPERRRPIPAVQGVGGGAAQSRHAASQDHADRSAHHHRRTDRSPARSRVSSSDPRRHPGRDPGQPPSQGVGRRTWCS